MSDRTCDDCGSGCGAEKVLAFTLFEHGSANREQKVCGAATAQGGALLIHLDSYGDFCSADGQGTVAVVELADGCPRVLVWADINQEDPTHTISLENAREDKRLPC